ncbi:prevent-host-death protein [Granulicella sp. 5B5]|uniref:prevent-host-death protein n=1 Tax=Granulicella sp. 5B5 TaxID=1617967 RepID=UPI0015F530EB|nr:prevent-host-death protein [Granulicella sp. 5B5]QMV20026.1 prevent-host-death protein [Granulicella sp. 5B5]
MTIDIPNTLAAQFAADGKEPAQALLEAMNVIQLAEEYQRQLDLAAEADEQEGIRQAREDIAAGRVYPAREVFEEMRQKYGIPR